MLLRLAYLGVTNALALLRLLPVSDRDKDIEILALRHQIMVLERQLGNVRPRFSPGDRAFLPAMLHRLPAATQPDPDPNGPADHESCRRELLDRTLIWNQQHLLHALHEYERFYNTHRPHQGVDNARPLQPLPQPVTDQATLTRLDIRRRQRLGGILNESTTPLTCTAVISASTGSHKW
ncbi:integrase core domain-containing protein [Actinosynnema sp. CA-299493]